MQTSPLTEFRVWKKQEQRMTGVTTPNGHTDDEFAVVMHFSRLFDQENRPIFEGDILAFTVSGNFEPKCAVIRDGDSFQKWYSEPRPSRPLNEYDVHTLKMKVIGNVFENPEFFGSCSECSDPKPMCSCL